MKKIINFKINIRQKEVIRLLKTKVSEITPQLVEAVEEESKRIQKTIVPAGIFETIAKDKNDKITSLTVSPPSNWVASSFYIVTIGDLIEKEIKDAQTRQESILSNILHTLAMEALDQTTNFICRLINSEAVDDECETAVRQNITDANSFNILMEFLPAEKIGIKTTHENTIHPLYSSAGIIFWLPAKKKK